MNLRIILLICTLLGGCKILHAQKFEIIDNDGVKIKYQVVSPTERTVQVTGGKHRGELIIPATVENNGTIYRVTSIKKNSTFLSLVNSYQRIQHLVLPEGLVEIGERAFFDALSLKDYPDIYIPSTVKHIGKYAFSRAADFGRSMIRDCNLECLPSFVDVTTCEEYGLSKGSVVSYWAAHRPQADLVESTINNAQAPQQATPVVEQSRTLSSDVDVDIPLVSDIRKKTFAIIIANEDYQGETKVDYAKNDGEVFKSYSHKTLGLPEKNVHLVTNATLNNLIGELDWLQKVCDAFSGEANVIFYYAGHGIPDEATSSAYLLPTDGNIRLLRTCFSINELYETLGKLAAKKVTVLMDACFSGAKRDGNMLASARGVAIKAKAGAPKGNMIVLSAAQGDETAYKYEETGHGLFTYFLLKKLQETKGNVTMGELSKYLQEQVKRYSIVENGKSQTPSVQISDKLRNNWESLRFD